MRKQAGYFHRNGLLSQLMSVLLAWTMVMSTLPVYATDQPRAEWVHSLDVNSTTKPRTELVQHRSDPAMITRRAIAKTPASPRLAPSSMLAALHAPALPGNVVSGQGSDLFLNAFSGWLFAPPLQAQDSQLEVSVGFADNSSASANFPEPWNEANPLVNFVGGGTVFRAGAIRLDNPGSSPVTADNVKVDLGRPGPVFQLWQNVVVPAGGSTILTQTQNGNFNTSASPIVGCGLSLAPNETRIPKITITVAGTSTDYADTAHVLDTGGFDSSCRGNQSLQWRSIGTAGPETPAGSIQLITDGAPHAVGTQDTVTVQVNDAGSQPLANAPVKLNVLNGPNVGKSFTASTDNTGAAVIQYSSSAQGNDLIQAVMNNLSGGSLPSQQATATWSSADVCAAPASPSAAAARLIYVGQNSVSFGDTVRLAVLLTDGTGNPLSGRSVSFTFAGNTSAVTTDGNGTAMVLASTLPVGQSTISISFAGDAGYQPAQLSSSVTVLPAPTLLRYTGANLVTALGTQQVSAVLTKSLGITPVVGRTVTFTLNGISASGITDINGNASATLNFATAQPTGAAQLQISFAGDANYRLSSRTAAVQIYQPMPFVIWGGNTGGLRIGQRVNFWGSQWESQVINGQYFAANPSFKGWSGALTGPIQQCQVNVVPTSLTPACWDVKPGQSFPPDQVLPSLIEVIVSTVVDKSGSDVFGNIACGAILSVDHTPPYGAVPGQDGFGTIAAVSGDCAGVFPAPAVLVGSQQQTSLVLPNQGVPIQYSIRNSGATDATSVTLNESFDQVTPASATANIGTIGAGLTNTGSFQVTIPAIGARQGAESSVDYQSRLATQDGRLFTSQAETTFTDIFGQIYAPVDFSSFSQLTLPRLSVGISGSSCIAPGSTVPYQVSLENGGSAKATHIAATLTLPDGTTATPAVPDLVSGTRFAGTVNWQSPGISGKSATESTQDYLARLQAADGTTLPSAIFSSIWQDVSGNAYGPVEQPFIALTQRIPIVSTTVPAAQSLLPNQATQFGFNVSNIGTGNAVQVTLKLKRQDGTFITVPNFSLPGGQSASLNANYRAPAISAKGVAEADAAYIARLQSANNSTLNLSAVLNWTDPAQNSYGPTENPFIAKEILPVVSITLAGPATAQAGDSISYSLTAINSGTAAAPAVSLALTLPNGSVQQVAAGPLAPGGQFQTLVNYSVPAGQAAGTISAQLSASWTDAAQNSYGPLSATAATAATAITSKNTVTLSPAIAGPDVTGSSQTMTATVVSVTGTPVSGATVQFNVTGANPTTGTATTNSAGLATFTYTGTHNGNDSVQATSATAVSNTATVSWITPVQNISTSTIFARFFASDNSGAFDTPATATPVFTQSFPTINFDPPAGTIPGNNSGIGVNTRPFVDVTTDLNGNFTGTIVAQGNGLQAGVGSLFAFQAVFTSTFTVASAGDVVLTFFADDGFILGIGGGATRVGGIFFNAPGFTPFENLPVMGGFNTPTAPVANSIVVHFPAPGSYPYELDYSECCGGLLALTMTVGQSNFRGVPPTGSLTISPNDPPTLPAGQTQTFTVQALDASGLAVPNVGVALIINGANFQQLSTSTGADGRATFSYSAVNAGTDTLQAVGNISGLGAMSNTISVNWSVPQGGGGTGAITFVPQGWIGGPLNGTVVQGQIPITVSAGINLTSGTLQYWPTSNPSDVHTINGNTTGSGTIGVFDATTLANGGYTVQLQATASNGTRQTSVIALSVVGENKPGRVVLSVTDLKLPLAGIPISITRTYDSLKRDTVQDFGFGWSLSTSVDLQVDAGNNVSFTMNGQRETFFFQAQPSSPLFSWLLTPSYVPQPGLHGTLTSDGCGGLIQVEGTMVCFPSGPYQPTTYTYTDPAGRVYVIAANGQIKSIKDLNANVLTFTPSGITSSAGGVTVPFVRDAQGRINQITDLNGNNYNYSYDSAGNLLSVALPVTNATASYTYSSDHLLQSETDPRGNTSQSSYFPNGRLQSLTDPLGNITQFSYDLTANTTTTTYPDGGVTVQTNNSFGKPVTITDPLQRTTSFTYDASQNTLTQTDALGKTTSFTYDVNGFRTSITDPLGHTARKTYNQAGQLTSATDALGNNIAIGVDAASNPVQESDPLGQMLAGAYDAMGNLTTLTNANGKTTLFKHDENGNLIQVTDPLNRITTYTYDAMNRKVSKIDPRKNTTHYSYDSLGHLLSVVDANNQVTRSEYDADGNKTADIDALNRRTAYTYDAANHLIKILYPDQTARSFTYDFRGNRLTETNQADSVTKYTYDQAGQLTSTTYAFGTPVAATISHTYDLDGRRLTETDARGNVKTYGYDAAGRLITIKNALGQISSFGYDANNNLTSAIDANQNTTAFIYDARSRLIKVVYPDKTTRQYTYDGMGNQLTETDPANQTTTRTYDDVNRLLSVTNALGKITRYGYDPANNLLSVTDANQHTTSFLYDNLNRMIVRKLPLGMLETDAYDAVGNLTAKTDFNGKTTAYSYDALNRLLAKTPDASLGESAVAFTYTGTGQRATMMDPSGTTVYTFDARDRLVAKATPQGTLSYTYDPQGNVLSIASSNANGASMAYSYDALNRVSTATDNRLLAQTVIPGTTTYNYDSAGNLAGYAYPNGVQTTQSYDSLDRLIDIGSSKATTISDYAYSLGAAGNRVSVAELGGRDVNYGYDANYRLTSEAISGDPAGNNGTIGYTYDAAGNRLQLTSTVGAIPSGGLMSYDANDRLLLDTYDANGNTTWSAGISSAYDFENHLTQQGSVTIVYDGDGNRVGESVAGVTTRYLVDTLNPTGYPQVMDELQNGAVVRAYSYGLTRIGENQSLAASLSPSFYGYDGHGNVRFLTDATGAVTDTYQFDAFGNLIASTGRTPNSFLYSAEQSDSALGLYYLRARYLNPQTGRFEVMDPEPGKIADPGTFHRYLYTRDNPVNLSDPTGRQELLEYEVTVSSSYNLYSKYPKAYAACTSALLFGVSNAFNDAVDGIDIGPVSGEKIATDFEKCIFNAVLPHPRELVKEQIEKLVKDMIPIECKAVDGGLSGLVETYACKQVESALDSKIEQFADFVTEKANIPENAVP
jgi:RHS repeat-associated protein